MESMGTGAHFFVYIPIVNIYRLNVDFYRLVADNCRLIVAICRLIFKIEHSLNKSTDYSITIILAKMATTRSPFQYKKKDILFLSNSYKQIHVKHCKLQVMNVTYTISSQNGGADRTVFASKNPMSAPPYHIQCSTV